VARATDDWFAGHYPLQNWWYNFLVFDYPRLIVVIQTQARRAGRLNVQTDIFTPYFLLLLLIQQGSRCAYCPKALTDRNFHLDHIQPLSKGGHHVYSNVQLTCRSCNLSKFTREMWPKTDDLYEALTLFRVHYDAPDPNQPITQPF
jgi:hypothetical protein